MTDKEKKKNIQTFIRAIKENVDAIRSEFRYLKSLGVRVQGLAIKGVYADVEAEHSDMRFSDGYISRVAEAFDGDTRPWGIPGEGERQYTLDDMCLRGR